MTIECHLFLFFKKKKQLTIETITGKSSGYLQIEQKNAKGENCDYKKQKQKKNMELNIIKRTTKKKKK